MKPSSETQPSQPPLAHRRESARGPLRLAVFDLDGTLKESYSPWRYLHEALSLEEQASVYRARFFAGEIDYLDWARLDAALWKGVDVAQVDAIFRGSHYRPGVLDLFRMLQNHGVRTAIVSTGLDLHVRQVAADLGVWRSVSNELLVRDGRLTGEVIVHVTEEGKGQIMTQLREETGAAPKACLAVGDGLADIDLFAQAALAVAVCPRDERVRRAAHLVIEDGNLETLIPVLKQRFRLDRT
jgi:phosphoserine phosphatase